MQREPYKKSHWYTHMKPYDVAIWERFIAKYPNMFDEVIYDLHVGGKPDIAPDTAPEMVKSWVMLNQKKIDVVGFKGAQVFIVEVKPDAGASAVGQVLNYKQLYNMYIDPGAVCIPVICTDRFDPQSVQYATSAGVLIYEV